VANINGSDYGASGVYKQTAIVIPGGWILQGLTFMRKNVMLVSRSTVDLRSCSRPGSEAGNVFYKKYIRPTVHNTEQIMTHCHCMLTGEALRGVLISRHSYSGAL